MSMLLYKDEAFEDRWTTVPSLTLDDDIFVKVFMVNNLHIAIFFFFLLFQLNAHIGLKIVSDVVVHNNRKCNGLDRAFKNTLKCLNYS